MGSAFYSEAQIWPWVRDPAFVMLGINWSDKEDYVLHWSRADCGHSEYPHLISDCGAFTGAATGDPTP